VLRFLDFPYDFDSDDNLFRDALTEFLGSGSDIDSEDLTFVGCYPEISLLEKLFLFLKSRISDTGMANWLAHQRGISSLSMIKGRKVWVTFENRRIPSEGADLTVSFDLDRNDGRNIYFPLLLSYIDFFDNEATYAKHQISFEDLKRPRLEIGKPLQNRKFACAFINNPDPVRLRFIRELETLGPVDVFGRYSGNYVENKIEVGNNYLLSICFENDLFPGYVTEKPLEAWLSRSVPVYWGDDAAGLLNSKGVINLKDSDSFKKSAHQVFEFSRSIEKMEKLIQEPLIRSDFSKPDLVSFLGKALS